MVFEDVLSSTLDAKACHLIRDLTTRSPQAGPKLCPLARQAGEPTLAIQTRLEIFMDKLYETPLPVPNARRPGYLTSGGFRGKRDKCSSDHILTRPSALILVVLEQPAIWHFGSQLLAKAMAGDGTDLYNILLPNYDLTAPDSDLARLAVSCLDTPRAKTQAEFPTPEMMADVALETIKNVSPHFGSSMSWGEPDGGCQFWPVEGPERFTGPWNHTLNNKILIISNTVSRAIFTSLLSFWSKYSILPVGRSVSFTFEHSRDSYCYELLSALLLSQVASWFMSSSPTHLHSWSKTLPE